MRAQQQKNVDIVVEIVDFYAISTPYPLLEALLNIHRIIYNFVNIHPKIYKIKKNCDPFLPLSTA